MFIVFGPHPTVCCGFWPPVRLSLTPLPYRFDPFSRTDSPHTPIGTEYYTMIPGKADSSYPVSSAQEEHSLF